jgi:uncharacterized protein YkwD
MMRKMAFCLVCFSAGLFALLGTGVSSAADPKDTTAPDLAAIRAEMIRFTNLERRRVELAKLESGETTPAMLAEDASLSSAAQKHAERLAQQQTLSLAVDLSSVDEHLLIRSFIYRAGQPESANAGKVIQHWMSGPDDRAAILNPRYTRVGVGVAYSATGVPYYTQLVAGRKPSPVPFTPESADRGCHPQDQ